MKLVVCKNDLVVQKSFYQTGSLLGTHQFDLFCTLTHRLYFDLNLTSTVLAKPYFEQNCTSTCRYENGRSTEKVELMRTLITFW